MRRQKGYGHGAVDETQMGGTLRPTIDGRDVRVVIVHFETPRLARAVPARIARGVAWHPRGDDRYQRGALRIAHAIGLARDFVADDTFCVVLGDNILRGDPLRDVANAFEVGPWGAGTLLHRVPDPERFWVAELDANGRILGFEEKPVRPKSDLIPIGVYFLRPDAFDVITHLSPSGRGEMEITDVLNHYVPEDRLFWREYTGHWSDAGTIDSLLGAAIVAAESAAKPVEAGEKR